MDQYVLASIHAAFDEGTYWLDEIRYLLVGLKVRLHHQCGVDPLKRMVSELWVVLVEQILRLTALGAHDIVDLFAFQEFEVVCGCDSTNIQLSLRLWVYSNYIRVVLRLYIGKGRIFLIVIVYIRVGQVQLFE